MTGQIYGPPQVRSPNLFGGPSLSAPSKLPDSPAVKPSGFTAGKASREMYVEIAREAARRHGVPEWLFLRQIQWESGFNPSARSRAGALGIAQIVPRWHPGVNPLDPPQALNYAARHMSNLYNSFGSWELALAAYNAGGEAVKKYGGIPPYKETQQYVAGIMGRVPPRPSSPSQQTVYPGGRPAPMPAKRTIMEERTGMLQPPEEPDISRMRGWNPFEGSEAGGSTADELFGLHKRLGSSKANNLEKIMQIMPSVAPALLDMIAAYKKQFTGK